MKKTALLLGTLLLVMSLALLGCSSTDDSSSGNDDSNTATEEPAAPEQSEEKTFTLDELDDYEAGKDGAKAYIAVDGVVYDVTDVEPWAGGEHNDYEAGKDLTEEIKTESPHGVSKLEGIPVVGKLE